MTLFEVFSEDVLQYRHYVVISANAKECLASGAVGFADVLVITGHNQLGFRHS
jgi:hypothetical protein